MAAFWHHVTKELYKQGHTRDTVMVVKNISETVTKQTLENYLEVVCKEEIEIIHLYHQINKVAIVEFKSPIPDLCSCISKMREKPLESQVIEMHILDECGGLLLSNVPDPTIISEDTMMLYFESKRASGGREECVDAVTYYPIGRQRFAVVLINDKDALSSILMRPEHKLSGHVVEVEPYFSRFHDYVLHEMKAEQKPEREDIFKEVAPHAEIATAQTAKQCLTTTTIHERPTEMPKQGTVDVKNVPLQQSKAVRKSENDRNPNILAGATGKFKLIMDGEDFNQQMFAREPVSVAFGNETKRNSKDEIWNRETVQPDIKYKRENDTLRRSSSDIAGQGLDDNSSEIYGARAKEGRKHRRGKKISDHDKSLSRNQTETDSLPYKTEEKLGKYKIIMLRIKRFCENCKHLEIHISLNETSNTVLFKYSNEGDLRSAKLKMYEIIETIEEETDTISPGRSLFLAKEFSKRYVREKCKKNKLWIYLESDVNNHLLKCYAFNKAAAKGGLQFLKDEIAVAGIHLREGQKGLVKCDHYITDHVTVFLEDSDVIIEGFKGPNVEATRRKIIDCLKNETPTCKLTIELNGGEANFFQKFIQANVNRLVSKKRGKLEVKVEKKDYPMKLLVIVEGDNQTTKETQQCIKQIWHESIDFRKISNDDLDYWLMMKGLDGDTGRQFFLQFQKDEDCFIDVTKQGQVQPPSAKFTGGGQKARALPDSREDSDEGSLLSDRDDGHKEEAERYIDTLRRDTKKREKQPIYKGNTFEEEVDIQTQRLLWDSIETDRLRGYSRPRQPVSRPIVQYADSDTGIAEFDPIVQPPAQPLIDEDYSPSVRQSRHIRPTLQNDAFKEKRVPYSPPMTRPTNLYLNRGNDDDCVRYGLQDTDQLHEQPPPVLKKEIHVGRNKVVVVKGEITKQRASALVNIVAPCQNLQEESVISKAFVKSGGPELVANYEMAKQDSNASVIVTQACGNLKSEVVMHVTLTKLQKGSSCGQIVSDIMNEVFEQCDIWGCKYLALPPLGVGRMYNYSVTKVARKMLKEAVVYLSGQTSVKEIKFVILDENPYSVFKKEFKSYTADEQSYMSDTGSSGEEEDISQKRQPPPYRRVHKSASQGSIGVPSSYSANTKNPAVMHARMQQRLQQAAQQQALLSRQQQPNQSGFGNQPTFARSNTTPPLTTTGNLNNYNFNLPQPGMSNAVPLSFPPSSKPTVAHRVRRSVDGGQSHGHHQRHQTRDGSSNSSRSNHGKYRSKSAERKYRTDEQRSPHKTRPKALKPSRFPADKPASELKIKVIAEKKEKCEKVRNKLSKKIKDDFLHEETIDKTTKISPDAKKKIAKVVSENDIKSIKGNKKYTLKGYKEKVKLCRLEIMTIILEDKEKNLSHTSSNEDRQRRRLKHGRETHEFVNVMANEEPETPKYWKNFKPGDIVSNVVNSVGLFLRGKKYKRETLKDGDPIYRAILTLVNNTWDATKIGQGADAKGLELLRYTKMNVLKIQRVENLDIYQKYAMKRKLAFVTLKHTKSGKYSSVKDLPNSSDEIATQKYTHKVMKDDLYSELNENYLFHGTKAGFVDTICNEGLDSRLGSGKAMLGTGVYGAESSSKADQYTDDSASRTGGPGQEKKMFLIRMLLGNVFLCNDKNPHKYRRAPCTKCYKDNCTSPGHTSNFDSVVGDNGKLFREFVVYSEAACYPEYLITYERV